MPHRLLDSGIRGEEGFVQQPRTLWHFISHNRKWFYDKKTYPDGRCCLRPTVGMLIEHPSICGIGAGASIRLDAGRASKKACKVSDW